MLSGCGLLSFNGSLGMGGFTFVARFALLGFCLNMAR